MPSPIRRRATLLLAAAAFALASCGSPGPRTGALRTGPDAPHPTCRVHQNALPDHDYTAGRDGRTLAVLGMLRYYTAQGSLPYCDGRPPTTEDTAWSRLYAGLTRS